MNGRTGDYVGQVILKMMMMMMMMMIIILILITIMGNLQSDCGD